MFSVAKGEEFEELVEAIREDEGIERTGEAPKTALTVRLSIYKAAKTPFYKRYSGDSGFCKRSVDRLNVCLGQSRFLNFFEAAMVHVPDEWWGGSWIAQQYGIENVQQLPVRSRFGKSRQTHVLEHDCRLETYQAHMRPAPDAASHLAFLLKHEEISLEFLARAFKKIDPQDLADWIKAEPAGQFAKRACFLFEWLTGQTLPVADGVAIGNYVEALDAKTMLVATEPTNVARWRVRDNLPGTRDFCPVVRWTTGARQVAAFDIRKAFQDEEVQFGADIMRRSAVWMTLRESRASFMIEGEQDQEDRIRRFAAVMEARTGQGDSPLTADGLKELQVGILGEITSIQSPGLRLSPVYVGQNIRHDEVIHYVAPHWSQVPAMLEGLRQWTVDTTGQSPVVRAAVAAFGLVYIHPLADGNGRAHRFLVNDMLRRDRAIDAPFILPVSALISQSAQERAGYDRALEVFSIPLMTHYGGAASATGPATLQDDGIESNFVFTAYDDALPAWRYPELTEQVTYLGGVLDRTIRQEMHDQAQFFRAHDAARAAVKEVIEGPNSDIDAMIRSARENQGKLSGKLAKRFPVLERAGVWERVATAIADAFEPPARIDADEDTVRADVPPKG